MITINFCYGPKTTIQQILTTEVEKNIWSDRLEHNDKALESIDITSTEINNLTLKSIYQQINLDEPSGIPLIIKLFENPKSPMALPGKISLPNHDCLHAILGLAFRPMDEAFILGFTMGNDNRTKLWHVKLFKYLSQYIYPKKYKFNSHDLDIFDLGFEYGKKLKFRNINQIEFDRYYDHTIQELRELFGIEQIMINAKLLTYSQSK